MQEGWNKNMVAHFDRLWVSVLDYSIQEWVDRYTFPGWMFVPRKPHPFRDNYHTVTCAKSKVIYIVEIVEEEDGPRLMGKKELEDKGETTGLVVRIVNLS